MFNLNTFESAGLISRVRDKCGSEKNCHAAFSCMQGNECKE
jgi:hypothetical protein